MKKNIVKKIIIAVMVVALMIPAAAAAATTDSEPAAEMKQKAAPLEWVIIYDFSGYCDNVTETVKDGDFLKKLTNIVMDYNGIGYGMTAAYTEPEYVNVFDPIQPIHDSMTLYVKTPKKTDPTTPDKPDKPTTPADPEPTTPADPEPTTPATAEPSTTTPATPATTDTIDTTKHKKGTDVLPAAKKTLKALNTAAEEPAVVDKTPATGDRDTTGYILLLLACALVVVAVRVQGGKK